MNYNQIKKLDEESAGRLTEGKGPVDQCICSILSPPEEDRKSIRSSIKKAFAKVREGKKKNRIAGQQAIDIPLDLIQTEKGALHSTKELIKHKGSCGKCGCDSENIVLKHSYANIRITTPDISSICPCPTTECMPEKTKLMNNIKVTVERVTIDPDTDDSETSVLDEQTSIPEPRMTDKKSISVLLNDQYHAEQNKYNMPQNESEQKRHC